MIICEKCKKEMVCKKMGVYVSFDTPNQAGDYKIKAGDLYQCKSCGIKVITGFGEAFFMNKTQTEYIDITFLIQ